MSELESRHRRRWWLHGPRALIESTLNTPGCRLHRRWNAPTARFWACDAGLFSGQTTGVTITADLAAALQGADLLIDFTRPEGTLTHLAACRAAGGKW